MSKNINIYDNNWIDIVFENRNHEYGAYQIRKSQNRNAVLGLVGMLSFLGLAFGCIVLFSSFKDKYIDKPDVVMPQDTFFILRPEMFPIDEPEVELTTAQEPKSSTDIAKSITFVEPKIVPDDKVPTELLPPTEKELENKNISSTTNTEGNGSTSGNAEPNEGTGGGGGIGISSGTSIGIVAEKMPEFPGGEEALLNYVKSKARFTPLAAEYKVTGTMYVSFVVDENGKVIMPKIERGLGYGMDEMLLSVVKSIPDFEPAEQNGQKVKIRMMLPVKFELIQ